MTTFDNCFLSGIPTRCDKLIWWLTKDWNCIISRQNDLEILSDRFPYVDCGKTVVDRMVGDENRVFPTARVIVVMRQGTSNFSSNSTPNPDLGRCVKSETFKDIQVLWDARVFVGFSTKDTLHDSNTLPDPKMCAGKALLPTTDRSQQLRSPPLKKGAHSGTHQAPPAGRGGRCQEWQSKTAKHKFHNPLWAKQTQIAHDPLPSTTKVVLNQGRCTRSRLLDAQTLWWRPSRTLPTSKGHNPTANITKLDPETRRHQTRPNTVQVPCTDYSK